MIPKSSTFKILLLWLPIFIWYLAGFCFSHSHLFFHQVDVFYYQAALHWIHAQALYDGEGNSFVYFPTTAILFTPLTLISYHYFVLIYRIICVAILSLGIYSFAKNIAKKNHTHVFFFMILATMLVSQAAIFVGQLHVMTTGLMLLAFSFVAREKYWPCAILLALSLALKPTSIVLYLLGVLVFPKMGWRLLLITAVIFLLSLIAQSPQYALTQYAAFAHSFSVAMHHDAVNPQQWATFFGALNFYTHIQIDGAPQFIIRLILAAIVFVLCCVIRKKYDMRDAIFFIVAIAMCYLMLFNSRTESNDYIMIAPLMGFSLSTLWGKKKYFLFSGLSAGIVLIAINWVLSKWLTPNCNTWINPTVVFFYALTLLHGLLKNLRRQHSVVTKTFQLTREGERKNVKDA